MSDAERELGALFEVADARASAGTLDAEGWRRLVFEVHAAGPRLDPERAATALESALQLGADLGYVGPEADLTSALDL